MKIGKNGWELEGDRKALVIATISALFLLTLMLVTINYRDRSVEAGQKALYLIKIHPATIQNNFTVELLDVKKDIRGLYSVILNIDNKNNITVYLTEDLKHVIMSRVYDYDTMVQEFKSYMEPIEFRSDCNLTLNGTYDAVFIYSETCPHCQKMIPFVSQDKTLKWYWIDGQDSNCKTINLTQFNFGGAVPYFYCLKTGQSHTGEFLTMEDFNNWVVQCKN